MNKLEYRKGCLVEAFKNGEVDCIAHGVNCQGVMASGIAKQIRQEFPETHERFRDFSVLVEPNNLLGHAQIVRTENGTIFNLFSQENYGRDNKRYVNYAALVDGFRYIFSLIGKRTLGIPKIGAGLGGGDWDIISTLIEETMYLTEFKGKVVVYEL